MTTLSLSICAHHTRREMAEDLSRQLDAPISMDEGDLGCVANHDAALRLAAEVPADWMVVVEDDIVPISNFREQAQAALAVSPAPFASLYYGYIGTPDPNIVARLEERDPCWVVLQGWYSAQCVAVRSDYVQPFLDKAQEVGEEQPWLPADHRWGEAAIRLGFWVPHSHPSLVEHRDDDSLITARPTPDYARRAYKVGSREEWTGDT